jgi:hypothetical protein
MCLEKIEAEVKNNLKNTIRIGFYCTFAALDLSRNNEILY